MSKVRRASLHEAKKKVLEIRDFHALGKKALNLKGLTIDEQAVELDCPAAKLGVARRFASGYFEEQLDELCDLINKYRALFGTSHVEILIRIPVPARRKFQKRCIKKNWSRRELIAAKTRRFKPKSKGGRHPQITLADVFVQIEDLAHRYCRMITQLKRSQDHQPSILGGFEDRYRDCVEEGLASMRKLRKASLAQLKKTQQAG